MIKITIGNINCKIQGATLAVLANITKLLSVRVPNYYFSTAYQTGRWDGYLRFFTRPANVFPTGLLPQVLDLLSNDMELPVELQDTRPNVYEYVIPMVPEDFQISSTKKARDYQVDTINKVITNTVQDIPFTRGIINIATNGGKTVIAEGIIKQLYPSLLQYSSNFLFVTHSKEIARQARKSIQTDLQIPVGMIGDGSWSIEPVTVALINTLHRRMKDGKDEWSNLKNTVVGFIADECLPAFTQILLPNGTTLPIKEVCARDDIKEVVSYNTQLQKLEVKPILRKIVTPNTDRFMTLWYQNPITEFMECLGATPNHKIWTENRGYIRADSLNVGDTLLIQHNFDIIKVPLLNVTLSSGIIEKHKYNLEIDDNHNYFADNILVSNCHHSSSDSWYSVFSNLPNANIRLGLTGTIDQSKPVQEMKLYACTGSIINKVSNDFLIQNGYSAKPKCILFKVNSPELGNDLDYSEAYQYGIVESEERNQVIYDICDKETQDGNKVLILVEHLEQGRILEERLRKLGLSRQVYFTNGQLSSETREELLDKMRVGDLDVLISSNILDEGIDISGINAVIYARGMKSMRKILQGIGRGLRIKKDNNVLRFYDFIDDTNMTLLSHSLYRYKTLKNEKFAASLLTVSDYKSMTWDEINGEGK